MPSIRQHNAWKKAGARLQAYWDRRQLKSVHERVSEHEKCLWFLVAVVSVLVAIVIINSFDNNL